VTRLRKMMLEELERRNYSEGTTRRYLRFVERFALANPSRSSQNSCPLCMSSWARVTSREFLGANSNGHADPSVLCFFPDSVTLKLAADMDSL
jgi:hypothetical protein